VKRRLNWIKRFWPVLVLVGLELVIAVANFRPGTYLVGWDNLFPEFDFWLNLKRNLFSVWQEYRGVGTLDGMSHAANLVHTLFIGWLSLVLPQNVLRYVFVFLMHLLGGVGMWVLLKRLLKKRTGQVIALAGAVFYMLNLATIQMFYLPFELFLVHYAFLPWLVWSVQEYLEKGGRKRLGVFGVLSLLATPQAHVPTVFVVYGGVLGTVLLFGINKWKRVLAAGLVTVVVNAFWLVPFMYGVVVGKPAVIEASKNNQMSTNDTFFRNQEFGDLESTALMRSFSLKFKQYNFKTGEHELMLLPWANWLDRWEVVVMGWSLFGLVVMGVIRSGWLGRRAWPFVVLWLFTFAIIGNDIPYVGGVSLWLRTNVPLFNTIFRFVFTKFFFLYAFLSSVMIAVAMGGVTEILGRWRRWGEWLAGLGLVVVMVYFASPVFRGAMFYDSLRVKIPNEYFEMFNWLRGEDESGRAVVLPMPWYWAWTQYDWGAIGSGFAWFGIKQPLLDRAFDPWSGDNENFYWEMSRAIDLEDASVMRGVLEKYQAKYVVVDEHIINPGFEKAVAVKQIEQAMTEMGEVKLVRDFNQIKIFQVDLEQNPDLFVSAPSEFRVVAPGYSWIDNDRAWSDGGAYVEGGKGGNQVEEYYPFRSLFSNKNQVNREFEVEELESAFVFRVKLPEELIGKQLMIPGVDGSWLSKGRADEVVYPGIFLDGKAMVEDWSDGSIKVNLGNFSADYLEVYVPKVGDEYSYDSETTGVLFRKVLQKCDTFEGGEYQLDRERDGDKRFVRLTSRGATGCLSFGLPWLVHDMGYVVKVESRTQKGDKGLMFSVVNSENQKAEIEQELLDRGDNFSDSYFVVPKLEGGAGYGFSFNNQSFGRQLVVNDLARIVIEPIPYDMLTGMKIVPKGVVDYQLRLINGAEIQSVEKWGTSHYRVGLQVTSDKRQDGLIVLGQGYDEGWIAFEVKNQKSKPITVLQNLFPWWFGERLEHVKVNGWENGFRLSVVSNQLSGDRQQMADDRQLEVVMVFWPQYLEWLGFVVLGGAVVVLVWPRGRGKGVYRKIREYRANRERH